MRFFAVIILSAQFFHGAALSGEPAAIAPEHVIETIQHFYRVLDIKQYDKDKLRQVVSDDFVVFEAAKKMDVDQFHAFLTHEDPNAEPLVDTDWQISDYRVSIDHNSAHVSYLNRGTFQHGDSLRVAMLWMESAFLISQNGDLKIKFLNSNLISKDIQKLSDSDSD
jgi:ketosteroid isomerase-like protein